MCVLNQRFEQVSDRVGHDGRGRPDHKRLARRSPGRCKRPTALERADRRKHAGRGDDRNEEGVRQAKSKW